jgi:hypothetical protein
VLRLEAGKRRPLFKEIAEGGLQVPESLLQGDTGNLTEPDKVSFLFPSRKGGAYLAVARWRLVLRVTVISKPKRLIVNEAKTPKGPVQKAPLAGARVAAEGLPHLHVTSDRLRKFLFQQQKLPGFRPAPKGWVSSRLNDEVATRRAHSRGRFSIGCLQPFYWPPFVRKVLSSTAQMNFGNHRPRDETP